MTTTYRELVVKGNASILKGFLWGFKTAKKIKKGLIFCDDHPIQTHHVRELLQLHGDYVHMVTSANVNEMIVAAIQDSAEPLELEIVSNRRIKEARFQFRFGTYSRDVATDLKRTLRKLPVSLELYGYRPKERIDPAAKGAELYSPVHDYEFAGNGKVRGEIEPLLRLHRKLDEHVFIEVDDIELVH